MRIDYFFALKIKVQVYFLTKMATTTVRHLFATACT